MTTQNPVVVFAILVLAILGLVLGAAGSGTAPD
jgi:hypothetical protein